MNSMFGEQDAFRRLAAFLEPHHPDYGAFTVVVLDDRSRDAVHHYLHRNLGGLMPNVLSLALYKQGRITQETGLSSLEDDEAFFRFHLLCRSEKRSGSPEESEQIFSFLRLLSRFSVTIEEILRLDRLTDDQRRRVEGIFALRERFRSLLATAGLFYLPFEEDVFASFSPRENDLFVGLPLMTPVNERLVAQIPSNRLFVPAALFGPHFPAEMPAYETAYHLVDLYRLPMVRGKESNLLFSEVTDRATLAALVSEEVTGFLKERADDEQMAVILLDEELAFYLWRFVFAPLGEKVNFSPWLPFCHFGVAQRIVESVEKGEDLVNLRESFVTEIRTAWHVLDAAGRVAYETAISLCDEFVRWRKMVNNQEEWLSVARYLVESKKLHLTGKRSAPVQVLGLGETGGVSFERALVLPMDRNIFPHKPFRGPYLNAIHTPRIYRAQFEANDLILRQFFSLCKKVRVAARYDRTEGHAPSPHFAFLATEFGAQPEECFAAPELLSASSPKKSIPNDESLREFLRSFVWSYSTLAVFFSCPFRFFWEYKEELESPPELEGTEEAINLHLGNVLHAWAASLQNYRPAIQRWRECFEKVWEEKVGTDEKHGEDYFSRHEIYKPLLESYLADNARWEETQKEMLLFADEGIEEERQLEASFGNGRYRLKGRLDRIQPYRQTRLILDLKYKKAEKIKPPSKQTLKSYLEEKRSLHDAHQLVFYAYLFSKNSEVSPANLNAAFLAVHETDPEKRLIFLSPHEMGSLEETLGAVATLLDERIKQKSFDPNFESDCCAFCSYRPLCGHPNGLV